MIGGYTEPRGSRVEFGALLLGYYRDGRLEYAGKVGHRLRHRDAPRTRRPAARAEARRRRRSPHPQAIKERRRHLGRAQARRPDRLHRVDPRRAPAPPPLPRPARRQGGRARWCARDDRHELTIGRRQVGITPPRQAAVPRGRSSPSSTWPATTSAWRRSMLPYVRDRPLALQAYPGGDRRRRLLHEVGPALLPGLDQARHGAQEGRDDHPGAGPGRRHARLPGRTERGHRRTSGCRAPTSPTSPTG